MNGCPEKEVSGKIKFDMTINLGHVFTMVSFVISLVSMWFIMNNRIIVLEEARTAHQVETNRINYDVSELKKVVREDINKIHEKLDNLIFEYRRNRR